LKWKKSYLLSLSNKIKGLIVKSKYGEDKKFNDFFHNIFSNVDIEENES